MSAVPIGGVLITNKEIDLETAEEIDKIFFEVVSSHRMTEEKHVKF